LGYLAGKCGSVRLYEVVGFLNNGEVEWGVDVAIDRLSILKLGIDPSSRSGEWNIARPVPAAREKVKVEFAS